MSNAATTSSVLSALLDVVSAETEGATTGAASVAGTAEVEPVAASEMMGVVSLEGVAGVMVVFGAFAWGLAAAVSSSEEEEDVPEDDWDGWVSPRRDF